LTADDGTIRSADDDAGGIGNGAAGRLRVAVDARTLQDRPPGGVGRTLAGVLAPLARKADLDLLIDGRRPAPEVPEGVRVHALEAPSRRASVWLQVAVPRFLHRYPGVFHCPFYGLPLRQPVPMVVSIYDLTFIDHPEWFPPGRRAALVGQARFAARTAKVVITGSATVADAIGERLGVGADRVLVVRPTVAATFLAAGDGARAAPAGPAEEPVPDGKAATGSIQRPYVVALGGARRRRLPVAVQAWLLACRAGADLDLVVVGTERPATGAGGLGWLGAVGDDRLARLLAGALAFLYPTAYEGFGLPALEAAACGTPSVCAPVGALPEVLGQAAQWSDGLDPHALARALLGLVGDPGRRERLARLARAVALASNTPESAAGAILGAYRRAWERA